MVNFDFSAPKVPIRRYAPLLRGTRRRSKNQNFPKNTCRVWALGLALLDLLSLLLSPAHLVVARAEGVA